MYEYLNSALPSKKLTMILKVTEQYFKFLTLLVKNILSYKNPNKISNSFKGHNFPLAWFLRLILDIVKLICLKRHLNKETNK